MIEYDIYHVGLFRIVLNKTIEMFITVQKIISLKNLKFIILAFLFFQIKTYLCT
jgi:hypothetical protein